LKDCIIFDRMNKDLPLELPYTPDLMYPNHLFS